ncbi:MAG TPA: GMC family oxidoreductase [Polyangiaceae bacterium]|nr:GMC family oxidoreductase [Polyangiaceae bacterium]
MRQQDRVVVIGSGPPGAIASLFLRRAGSEVLLLEAGHERAAAGVTLRVRGLTVAKYRGKLAQRTGVAKTGDPNAELYEQLAPGGLTNHWSCAVPRFSQEDFDDAERAGEQFAWPLGYEDLAPWYERVEPFLHIAGSKLESQHLPSGNVRHLSRLPDDWSSIVPDAERSGRAVVPMPYAYGADTSLTWSGTAFNSYTRLIKPALNDPGLSVRYGARVLRLEWDSRAKRVSAVVFRDARSGSEERVECRAVVVAGGAVNTPQILLQSKSSDFPHGLGNSHGVLGRYLHDHPLGKLVLDLGTAISVHPAMYITRLAMDQSRPLYAAAGMQWSGAAIVGRSALSLHPGRSQRTGFSVFGTTVPTTDNWIALDPEQRSADGTPGIEFHIRHTPAELDVLNQTKEQIVSLLSRAGFAPKVQVWKVEAPGNSNHLGGTCRMHALPKYGMLDRWSRIHEVRNVVVADSSAFTTGPEKNPVLTSMTLAARASDRLAEELKSGDL